MENSKFKASQHLIKSNQSKQTLNLADNINIQINEKTATDDDKFTNFSKKFEVFVPFRNLVEVCFLAFLLLAKTNDYIRCF